MTREIVDIEDETGTIIGKFDLETSRALAPHPEVDEAIADGRPIYMRKNAIRSELSLEPTKKRRR